MAQPLFFTPDLTFEKLSAETAMPEDANAWPNELMQELYRQVPYVADFEPHVVMDRVDAERGYGFGHVEVQNQTEIQQGAPPDATEAAGIRQVRIPVVIKDRKLQPLDLLVTTESTVLPLTESRLREALFRPQTFDITGRGPGDMSMIGQLYPPYRQNYGFGGGGATMNVGMGKEGQSLLVAVLPTIDEAQQHLFLQKFAQDDGLLSVYEGNTAAGEAARLIFEHEPVDQRKLASTLLARLVPNVVQVRKEAEGYSLKSASYALWAPATRPAHRGEVVRLFGEKIALEADTTGSATLTNEAGVSEGLPQADTEEDQPMLISQFGIYKVQDDQGRHLIGFVFPNLIGIDGTSLPIALFTNGSQKALQGEIVGINVGGGASLFEGPPKGTGCFYYLLPNGRAQATVPLTIQASMEEPVKEGEEGSGITLHAQSFDGQPVQICIQPGLEHIVIGTEGEMLVPDSYSWLPLDKAEDTHLVDTPEAFGKEAMAKRAMAVVTLRCGGQDAFSLEGFPIDKLAQDERSFLSMDDTLFLLAGLGADLTYAMTKMGEAAAFQRPVDIRIKHYLKTAASQAEALRENVVTALSKRASVPCIDLVKEAAVIPDPVAVDTVLSLGFLNSENVGTFISYLPTIDAAQKKLCELLFAVRLGLQDIPAGALERAIRSIEEVIEGLKIQAFAKQ